MDRRAGAAAGQRQGVHEGVGVAAVLRLVLSEERAGLLVVRSKGIDFVTTVTVAAAMVYIASTIDPLGTG
ncbi:DUF3017 domain-containing protein [Mycobacterium tuberculosis]|uniref:DUF3017 domain-containing protein n=1 Tax=Mycobacterium tuberculosis TaxID=1773 RepID=UPI0009A0DF1B